MDKVSYYIGVVVGFLCSAGAYYIIQIVRWKIEEKRNA